MLLVVGSWHRSANSLKIPDGRWWFSKLDSWCKNSSILPCRYHICRYYDLYSRGVLLIQVTSLKINANCFEVGCDQVACPSSGSGTFLMITEWQTCLTWLRQQPTPHIFSLKVDVLSIKTVLSSLNLFCGKEKCNIFNEGGKSGECTPRCTPILGHGREVPLWWPLFLPFLSDWILILCLVEIWLTPSFCRKKFVCLYPI